MSGFTIEKIENDLYSNNEKYLSLDLVQKQRFENFFYSLLNFNKEQNIENLIEVCYDMAVNYSFYIISEREHIENEMKERASCIIVNNEFIEQKIDSFDSIFDSLAKKNKFFKENNMFSKKDKKKKYFKNLK